ncbi:Na-translocating system protein MpsC family protein [Planomicrobium sp. CPCC 101110]|uniref:Na-translocating system protein MpsC family protein n=1 Tax=Planomicrobium sp. CPCC 101110 TaxID=2599619 RepID=UPI0016459938|nr:Na-translocating system protein MpsC family protein [Planomicrobium sp. CPCC 101110]
MSHNKTVQIEIGGYISNLFRTHFGKGPTAVYVTIEKSFITIHFLGFLAGMEKNLLGQNEVKRVLASRDMVIRNLTPEIMQQIEELTGYGVIEFYTDWNFEKETGLMIGIINKELEKQPMPWPNSEDEQALRDYLDRASLIAQKIPEHTDIFWLNDRTLLVQRSGILLEIEKEFIRNGFLDELKLSKRQLERRAFQEARPENVLRGSIEETFLFWNFEKDRGYTVFRLAKENQKEKPEGLHRNMHND